MKRRKERKWNYEVAEWPFHSEPFNKLKKLQTQFFPSRGFSVAAPISEKNKHSNLYKNNKNKTTTMVATQRNMARRITKWVKTDLRSTGQHVVGHALVGYRNVWWKNGKNTFFMDLLVGWG